PAALTRAVAPATVAVPAQPGPVATVTGVPAPVEPARADAVAIPAGMTPVADGQAPASTSSTAQPASAAQPAVVPEQARALIDQLGARLVGLRAAGEGQHVMTVRVDPDTYGPVRVVAHISGDGVRIELVGAGEQAREALRAALPDLRRDLAAGGLNAELGLGSGSTGDRGGEGRA
ncbi:hypothetical protein N869_13100, partial [Cellulomonas bogoriensis 69B4 = DSM 16987]